MSLGDILTGAARILASTNPVTGILADVLLPKRVAQKTGADPDLVSKIISGIKTDPEVLKLKMESELKLTEIQAHIAEIQSGNLKSLDTDDKFSFWEGLLGSPRRFGVTILSGTIGYLIITAGTRAIWMGSIAADPDGLAMILKYAGATLFGLAGAYVSKYFRKDGG